MRIVVLQPPVDFRELVELDGAISIPDDQKIEEESETQSSLSQKDVPVLPPEPVQLLTPESTPSPFITQRQWKA